MGSDVTSGVRSMGFRMYPKPLNPKQHRVWDLGLTGVGDEASGFMVWGLVALMLKILHDF